MNVNTERALLPTTPIIAIASGKGGVGKTSLTLNLATTLAKQGKKVLVFDGDLGLGNVDVQLGLMPEQDLSHVMKGHAELEDILLESDKGFHILPGRSGSETLPFLNALQRRDVLKKLRNLSGAFDVVFLDIAAGVNDEVLGLTNFADKTAIVATPDPSSITDAYAVVKLLKNKFDKTNCQVLVNQAATSDEGQRTYEKLQKAAENFLNLELPLLGVVPYDRDYSASVKMQKLTVQAFPNSKATQAIDLITKKLLNK